MTQDKLNGILLVNKPFEWSSFDVVRFARKKLGIRKIGHGGTLDPLAEGLLVLLIGNGTKLFDRFQEMEKEYVAEITFGEERETQDSEGKITRKYPKEFSLDQKVMEDILKSFEGDIMQKPPAYSALKINGQAAYKLARKGREVNLKKRKVHIRSIKLLKFSSKKIEIRVNCSSGTYIRTLAFDIGKKTGFGAYLSSLKRTKIGKLRLSEAVQPEAIDKSKIKEGI